MLDWKNVGYSFNLTLMNSNLSANTGGNTAEVVQNGGSAWQPFWFGFHSHGGSCNLAITVSDSSYFN